MTPQRWNRWFDRAATTRMLVAGRSLPSFPTCGAAGLLLATGLAAWLTARLGLSPVLTAAALLASGASFFALALATKVLTGEERLVFFRHQLAALLSVAAVVHAGGVPLLPYLDIAAAGIGLFLFCGRAGCLMVGCCHGLPSTVGPRYGPRHTEEGFPAHLEAVRLAPLQLFDAAAALAGVVAGVLLMTQSSEPGGAFASCVGIYAAARFHLDYLRGASGRRRLLRLTESQWTALLQLAGIALAAKVGALPSFAFPAATLALAVCVAEALRRLYRGAPLLDGDHVRELARGLQRPMTSTSRGILLSVRTVRDGAETIRIQTVSSLRTPLSPDAASNLARLIARLRGSAGNPRIIAADNHTFHVLLRAPREDRA